MTACLRFGCIKDIVTWACMYCLIDIMSCMSLTGSDLLLLPVLQPPPLVCARPAICRGDGFVTEQSMLTERGLQDANPFFQELLSRKYRNQARLQSERRLLHLKI